MVVIVNPMSDSFVNEKACESAGINKLKFSYVRNLILISVYHRNLIFMVYICFSMSAGIWKIKDTKEWK